MEPRICGARKVKRPFWKDSARTTGIPEVMRLPTQTGSPVFGRADTWPDQSSLSSPRDRPLALPQSAPADWAASIMAFSRDRASPWATIPRGRFWLPWSLSGRSRPRSRRTTCQRHSEQHADSLNLDGRESVGPCHSSLPEFYKRPMPLKKSSLRAYPIRKGIRNVHPAPFDRL